MDRAISKLWVTSRNLSSKRTNLKILGTKNNVANISKNPHGADAVPFSTFLMLNDLVSHHDIVRPNSHHNLMSEHKIYLLIPNYELQTHSPESPPQDEES